MKNKLFIVLIVLVVAHFLFRVFEYRTEYTTPFNAKYWEQKYNNSQWAKVDSEEPIGDDGLYTHAAWEYMQGRDPTTLNAELPPFGKYLIGLSELLFKNQNIFALLSGIFVLVSFYLVNTLLFKNKLFALIPVFIFSLEPLFYTQLRAPFLDLLYLGLLLMTFYFFLKKKFIGSAIFLGLMAATKSTASTLPLVIGTSGLYLLFTKQFIPLRKYLITLPIAGIVFVLTYFQFFLHGKSVMEFLSVQKWIIDFYAGGAKGTLTAPWEILFTGKYANWWGQVSIVSEWHIGWLLSVLLALLASFFILRKYRKSAWVLVSIWMLLYTLFLSFVPVWSRYFLLLLPFTYALSFWFILYVLKKHETR